MASYVGAEIRTLVLVIMQLSLLATEPSLAWSDTFQPTRERGCSHWSPAAEWGSIPPCCWDGTSHPGESEVPVPIVQFGEGDSTVPATSGRLELSGPKGPKVDLSLNTLR